MRNGPLKTSLLVICFSSFLISMLIYVVSVSNADVDVTKSSVDSHMMKRISIITITKQVVPTMLPEPGGEVTFTVGVTNTSEMDSVRILSIEDSVFPNISDTCDHDLNIPLEAGDTITCMFTEPVSGNANYIHTNVVTVTGRTTNTAKIVETAEATVTITDVPSSISVSKTSDPTTLPEPGGDVDYTVVVENTSVVDTVTIESISDNMFGDISDDCDQPPPHDLAPGEMIICEFTEAITGDAGDTHTNIVAAAGMDDDGGPVVGSDNAIVTFTQPVKLDVFLPTLFVPDTIAIINGGFEIGDFTGWLADGEIDSAVIDELDIDGRTGSAISDPLEGAYSAELGNPLYQNDSVPVDYAEIRQRIFVPKDKTRLTFSYRILTHDVVYSTYFAQYVDTFEVYINSTNVNDEDRDVRCSDQLGEASGNAGLILCDGKESNPTLYDPPADLDTKTAAVDLSEHEGKSVEIIFRVYNRRDGLFNTWAYVDDVKFE